MRPPAEINITFSPLSPNTKYSLYYVITNEDPFIDTRIDGEVQELMFETKSMEIEGSSLL